MNKRYALVFLIITALAASSCGNEEDRRGSLKDQTEVEKEATDAMEDKGEAGKQEEDVAGKETEMDGGLFRLEEKEEIAETEENQQEEVEQDSQQSYVVDYPDAASFEAALNSGKDVTGKIVTFRADELHPQSAYGYNIWAGEHLNFVSARNPGIEEGSYVTVAVTDVLYQLKSYMIYYEILEKNVEISEVGDGGSSLVSGQEGRTDNNNQNVQDGQAVQGNSSQASAKLSVDIVGSDLITFNDYGGDLNVSAYTIVKNNTDRIITYKNTYYDYEDNSGKWLTSDKYTRLIPEALKPGQTGYIFSYYHDLTNVSIANGIKGNPHIEVVECKDFYEISPQDITFQPSTLSQNLKVIGRGNNASGREVHAEPGAIFFDASGKVVGCCYGLETFPANSIQSYEISGDMMSFDMKASSVSRVEVFIQGDYSW